MTTDRDALLHLVDAVEKMFFCITHQHPQAQGQKNLADFSLKETRKALLGQPATAPVLDEYNRGHADGWNAATMGREEPAPVPTDDVELTELECERLHLALVSAASSRDAIRAVAAEAYRIRRERPIEVTGKMVNAAFTAYHVTPVHEGHWKAAIAAALAARRP